MVEFSAAEDWDNDEYTGSLSDTKVFTPSGSSAKAVGEPVNGSVGHPAPGGNYTIFPFMLIAAVAALNAECSPTDNFMDGVNVPLQVLGRALWPTTVSPTASQ